MKPFVVPGIPFVLSLVLSLCTVGSTVYWQDSGFFLAGVKDLGVLYPPGFVLYLISCRAWTFLWGFLDFTFAVHLYSALCAALAAAAIALASRDLLRSRGALFRVGAGEGDLAAIVAGSLAAAGYTFWSAALLAKPYALLYLILALAIWRMIRADETGKGRDFTIVAALIGLAWAAHPSAATMGLAFLLFASAHYRTLGSKGLAWRAGVAAGCAIVPSLLLPVLALRDPSTMFGNPTSFGEWFRYLRGARFTDLQGVFGFEPWRGANAVKYLWEDFLGVGLAVALVGLSRLAVVNRKLLLGIAAWTVPSALVATLFKIEGQQDLWLVAAWLPLHLAVAVGISTFPPRALRAAALSLGAVGVAWAVAANGRAVSMRAYSLAEQFGRFHLEPLDPDSILLLESDDALSTTRYLQTVRGVRPDVLIVDAARLGSPWYLEHLRRRDPRLKLPDQPDARSFALANVDRSRSAYFESSPAGLQGLAPVGPLLRLAAAGEPNEPRDLAFPVDWSDVRSRAGRERGIRLEIRPDRLHVEPEAYERRWVALFVRAQVRSAQARFQRGDYRRAAELLESARAADPEGAGGELVHLLGVCHYLLNDYARSEPLLKQSLRLGTTSRQRVRALSYLAGICRSQGRAEEALRYQNQAMGVVGSDPELRREFEQFSRPR